MSGKIVFVLIAAAIWGSCASPEVHDIYSDPDFESLTEMHCRARVLKAKRFSLAEEMRQNPIEGKDYDGLSQEMENSSRLLADSIRRKLSTLTAELSLEQKRTFNDSIQARIDRMGCEKP